MSELNVYHHELRPNEYDEFYLKYEADKVIAELKQKINEAQTELELWRDGSIISETHQKELDEKRHSDYKRCLAMAMWCHNQREIYERDSYNWELEDDAVNSLRNKANIMRKWRKRWLKLAENFKEAK